MYIIRNNLFSLQTIDGNCFLVPSGQATADMRKALMVNETGAFIWKKLESKMSREHLISLVLKNYSPDRNDVETISSDVCDFLSRLSALGMLVSDDVPGEKEAHTNTFLKIAGLTVKINSDNDILCEALRSYSCDPTDSPDLFVRFRIGFPAYTSNGTVILRNREILVMECDDRYILIYRNTQRIGEIHIFKDLRNADIYSMPPYDDLLKNEFFTALRTPFLLNMTTRGMFMLHSSSVLLNGELVLFSAPSGVGKSTHANIWKETFNVPVINGDCNLLKPEKEKVYAYGTPWCGTSGISSDGVYPVKAVFFLKRGNIDLAEQMEPHTAALSLMARTVTPLWNTGMTEKVLALCIEASHKTTAKKLSCTPTVEAARCAFTALDTK